jgi:hypothetical protein
MSIHVLPDEGLGPNPCLALVVVEPMIVMEVTLRGLFYSYKSQLRILAIAIHTDKVNLLILTVSVCSLV